MITKERTINAGVTCVQRRIIRQIPLKQLQEAQRQLVSGRSEWYVCTSIGISPDNFDGNLHKAVEEVLWERGSLQI